MSLFFRENGTFFLQKRIFLSQNLTVKKKIHIFAITNNAYSHEVQQQIYKQLIRKIYENKTEKNRQQRP